VAAEPPQVAAMRSMDSDSRHPVHALSQQAWRGRQQSPKPATRRPESSST